MVRWSDEEMRFKKSICWRGTLLIFLSLLLFLGLPPREEGAPRPVSGPGPGRRMAGETKEEPGGEPAAEEPELPSGPGEGSLAGVRVHGLPNISGSGEVSLDPVEGDATVEIARILANIERENREQAVRNLDMFGPVTNDTVVILVQVHDRLTYLKQLLLSLSQATGVEKTLLVFSHDVWDPEINSLVRSIKFAPVAQMFYPFSLQTHPRSFPGETVTDCPRDLKPDKARRTNCTNSKWPDIHGHYREATFTQTKHHWWWKTNRLFNGLEVTKHFFGSVVFLEEDHYVAADFLHVLALMNAEKKKLKDKVDIISLGTYLKKFNVKMSGKQVEVTEWMSSKHNMGMAFTRDQWKRMLGCSDMFCRYDDYNWDWSLQHISNHCLKQKLQVMMVKGPRVFHIGECGVHHKKADCDSSAALDKVLSIVKSAASYFFPESVTLVKSVVRKKTKAKKGNGGWGDHRDHALCHNMTRPLP